MKTFVLSLFLSFIALLAVGAPAPAAADDEFVIVFPLAATTDSQYIRQPCSNGVCDAGEGGELLSCELVHEARSMALRITNETGTLLDFMKAPTGATDRYVNPYQGRNPPKPGYTKFKGQTCEDGCYATVFTASTGQALKCEVRP